MVKLWSLVANIVMRGQYLKTFSARNRKYIQNLQISLEYIFHILEYFATKLHYFMKFNMLYPAVLIYVPNSKVFFLNEE